MGDDGAQGLLELRRAGCYALAEDESTGVRLAAACGSLPLPALAPCLLELP